MPIRWTIRQENRNRAQLIELYVKQNKTIFEVADMLGLSCSGVEYRLKRLKIPFIRARKQKFNNKKLICFPTYSKRLAEFFGILLGDGHLSIKTGQVFITINAENDDGYATYLQLLIKDLFEINVGFFRIKKSPRVLNVFVTSVDLVKYLNKCGLISTNKVKDQVNVPAWIFSHPDYIKGFLKGFFDTDGSIYKLRFGVQMSFTNKSLPLLKSIHRMLLDLGFHPSKISQNKNIYLTRRVDLRKYIVEISFGNIKHRLRALKYGILGEAYIYDFMGRLQSGQMQQTVNLPA